METTIAVLSSSEVPSSDVVISNDDLFIEILLRLPVSSLVILKSVSKRWLTLITNPNFITLHRSQNPILEPPSGLYIQRGRSFKYTFLPLDIRIPSPATTFSLEFDSHKVEILQSCNGLILCRNMSDQLYVYNPSTNRFKPIHKPPYYNRTHMLRYRGGFRMAFDPSKSHHYKIMHAGLLRFINRDFIIQIHIYSSETCDWSVCRSPFLYFRCFVGFSKGIYWNGGVHWLDDEDLLYMLDVEHPVLTSIRTPQGSPGNYRKLFESRGCLLLFCTPFHSPQLSIYEMSKECSSWSVRYIVNLDDIRVKYPKTKHRYPEWFCSCVQCIMIGKKEEDSFLLMEIHGEIIKYKMVSKTMCKIYDLGSLDSSASFEFIASFACV